MKRKLQLAVAVLMTVGLACLLSSCNFQAQADAKFGDQHFKTAIALIELYRLRHGVYPDTLGDITFAGEWDAIAFSSVHYQRLNRGYELDVARGWVGQPQLSYPPEFWKNLGIVKTNVGGKP